MDDITVDSEKQLQEILNQANLFLKKWYLKLNPTKSAVVIFHSKQTNKTQNQFKIGSDIIKIEIQHRFLGKHLTSELTLTYHIIKKITHSRRTDAKF